MTDAERFAAEWAAAWNSHDLDRIMAHYRDDVVFRSRKAVAITGAGEVRGRSGLRAYWAAALERQPDLHFTVQDVFTGHEMMVITYLNHRGKLAAETLWFDEKDRIWQASACHRED